MSHGYLSPSPAAPCSQDAPTWPEQKERVVCQAVDRGPGKWNLALNNANKLRSGLGKVKSEVKIVVYGPGIGMLKSDSAAASRVSKAIKEGVKVPACEHTMTSMKLSKADMNPHTSQAPGGVIERMSLQKAGWAYSRP